MQLQRDAQDGGRKENNEWNVHGARLPIQRQPGRQQDERDVTTNPGRPKAILSKEPEMIRGRGIGDFIPNSPLPYAVRKLENKEYVELWYFTSEAYIEARASSSLLSYADDALVLTRGPNGITLELVATLKPSPNAMLDENLSLEQLSSA